MSGITAVLANPATVFYEGSAVSGDVPDLLPISLGGHAYPVDLREYERTTIDAIRPGQDQSPEPGDQSLSNVGIWKRKGIDWRLGAGQIFFDDEAAVQSRFRVSKGVDPWTTNRLSLHKATDQKRSSANTNLKLLPVLGYLYIADGNEVYHSADPSVDNPTWTSATIHVAEGAVAVNSICSDGSNVYAALGTNGIHKTVHGASTSTHFSAYAATLVAFANGRLLAAKAGEVVEISNAGVASSPVLSHFNPNATIAAICPSPTGIYVAVNIGDTAEFYFIGFNATTGALAPAISAGQLPSGETVNAMTYYGGLKALGTSRGLRLALIVQDKGLDPQPVIEDYGAVRCLHGRGEFLYFGITNLDSASTGIGRADLSRFPGLPGVPAYATDLMAGKTGASVQGNVQSVATFNNKRYFAVSGNGVWGDHWAGVLVDEGRVSSGLIRFTSTEKKIVTNLDLRHEPLNGEITARIALEDGAVVECGSSTVAGSLSPPSALAANQASSEFPELELILKPKVTESYVTLDGNTGNYVSTPDSVALSITGDIDLRAKAAPNDWTPADVQAFVSKHSTTNPGRGYRMHLTAAGELGISWSPDGLALNTLTSTVTIPAATGIGDGQALWVRATLDVDNGAAGHTGRFYTSTDGVTWTQLGADVVGGGTTSIADNDRPVTISGWNVGVNNNLAGKIYKVEIRSGIDGTVVASPAFDGTPTFPDAQGNTWTLNGTAAVTVLPGAGPVLKRWALRGIVVPIRTDAIVLPLIVKSTVNVGHGEGQDYPLDPLDEFLFLKDLEAQRRVVTLQEGDFADSVIVDQVRVKPEKWMKNRRWYEGLVYVRCLSMGPVTQGV